MKVILLTLVVLASLLIIASGIWVGAALIRALSLPRRPEPPARARRDDGRA
jgi:hypothetical protein